MKCLYLDYYINIINIDSWKNEKFNKTINTGLLNQICEEHDPAAPSNHDSVFARSLNVFFLFLTPGYHTGFFVAR